MYSFEMTTIAVTDFTEEIYYKMQNVEAEKIMGYCTTINESATESAKTVTNGMKTMLAKIMDVFEEQPPDSNNPLMIDLVIRNVFLFLDNKDLCSCRLVCRLWRSLSDPIFRETQRIVFYPESVDKLITFTQYVNAARRLEENFEGPPFSTFCFTAQYNKTQFPRKPFQNFVTSCGEFVKKLEIFYPDEGQLSPEDFQTFFLSGMRNTESIHFINLPRSLTKCPLPLSAPSMALSAVTKLRIDRTFQMETCWSGPFLSSFFLLLPSLREYELWTWNSTTEEEHSLPYFLSLSETNRRTLKVLRPGSVGDKIGMTIASLQLSLSKLFLPVLNRDTKAETIEALLQSQSQTLEELILNCSTMQDTRLLVFPVMRKLKSLHMIITYPWSNDYTIFNQGISYRDHLPLLKVLRVELAIYNDSNFIKYFFPCEISNPCETLEELDLSFSGFRDERFIPNVSKIFPNVKKLKLDGYGNRIFSQIFNCMEKLESLEVFLIYGFNLDDQMTGFSKEVCASFRKNDKFEDSEDNDKALEDEERRPSLCSLKNLRTLVIKQKDYQAKFWPDAQCVTNATAVLAFSKMRQLKKLHLERVKFSEECRKYLALKLPDCWLDFA